jgi:hypothetical protein
MISQHHQAWLNAHPDRSVEWLKNMTSIGFDVHHIDGNHLNNDYNNLVLIEHLDHMRLHESKSNRLLVKHWSKCKRVKPMPLPLWVTPEIIEITVQALATGEALWYKPKVREVTDRVEYWKIMKWDDQHIPSYAKHWIK